MTSTDPSMPSYYAPSQTALLLLDFHSMFVSHIIDSKGEAALSAAAATRKWAKAKGFRIVHCLLDAHSTPFPECKTQQRWISIFEALKTGAGDEPAVLRDDAEGEVTFLRRGGLVSALKSPGLVQFLHENGIKSLVLAGLSTSGCVMRTAIAAADEQFVVTVLEDACADNDQNVHDLLVGKILPNRGYVFTADGFREGWEERSLGL